MLEKSSSRKEPLVGEYVERARENRLKRLSMLLEVAKECQDVAITWPRFGPKYDLWMDLHWAALGLYTDLLMARDG